MNTLMICSSKWKYKRGENMDNMTQGLGFLESESPKLDSKIFGVFDPICSLGVIRLAKPFGEPIEIASGSGETDDLKFEFRIECENRNLTGSMYVVVRTENKVLSSSFVRAVLPSNPDGIISVWKVQENGIIRDILMIARKGFGKEPGRLDIFASEVHTCDTLRLGGELKKGYISIQQLDTDL